MHVNSAGRYTVSPGQTGIVIHLRLQCPSQIALHILGSAGGLWQTGLIKGATPAFLTVLGLGCLAYRMKRVNFLGPAPQQSQLSSSAPKHRDHNPFT